MSITLSFLYLLVTSVCIFPGVDFDSNTDTCYYLREIDNNLMKPVAGVAHYRITKCDRKQSP